MSEKETIEKLKTAMRETAEKKRAVRRSFFMLF